MPSDCTVKKILIIIIHGAALWHGSFFYHSIVMNQELMKTETNREKILKKNDIVLIVTLLIVAVIIALFLHVFKSGGAYVVVTVDGNEVERLSLDEDTTRVIEGYNGGTNELVIKDGKAYIKQASCPDGLCVHMGQIDSSGQSIICLPNRVVVTIEGEVSNKDADESTDDDVDVIVGG